jgi:uncharacterized protein
MKWGPMPVGQNGPVAVSISKNVMIPMRDGVRLATDIYRPLQRNGDAQTMPMPVILTRTPYDKSNPVMQVEPVGNFFAAHGYAVAIQDVRGRGESEDVGNYHHIGNPLEGQDGYDTIEWLAKQPWSTGKVGMVGTSYSALVQNAAMLKHPPSLKAVWIDSSPTSGLDWECRRGGAMAMQMFPALFIHAMDAPEIRNDPAAMARIEWGGRNIRKLLRSMPFKPGLTPLAAVPNLERVLFRYYYDGCRNDWWGMEAIDFKSRFADFPDIPSVFSTGWYDLFTEEVTQQFAEMHRTRSTPQRLVVGPWNHTAMRTGVSVVGECDFGQSAAWGYPVYNRERLKWFDRWLKDIKNGVDSDPPVQLFVMGGGSGQLTQGHILHGGEWRSEQNWPIHSAVQTPYYLKSNGELGLSLPGPDDAPLRWTHDPNRPVPTLGASVAPFLEFIELPAGMSPDYVPQRGRTRTFLHDGPMHQREREDLFGSTEPYLLLAERCDVVVFQTEELEHDMEVIGQIRVHLWVSSNALDTDFTAKLVDQYPPTEEFPEGYHMNIVDSILRARFRNGFDKEELMQPGNIYPITIILPPTANRFCKGHRLRVDIASSSFPQFDVNPNTGELLGRHTFTICAQNTVYADSAHPSHIILPVVPVAPQPKIE